MEVSDILKKFKDDNLKEVKVRITEDVDLLKNLSEYPKSLKPPRWNYYVEEIEVEYYVAKLGQFVQIPKYMFINLIEPQPEKSNHKEIYLKFKTLDTPIDIVEVMNIFPQHMIKLLDYYGELMNLHERVSFEIKAGLEGDTNAVLRALYLTEVLKKREPTLSVFEILGDYIHFNINWFIRYLNKNNVKFSLEDNTVHYLINVYLSNAAQKDESVSKRFLCLRDIYLDQVFGPI